MGMISFDLIQNHADLKKKRESEEEEKKATIRTTKNKPTHYYEIIPNVE